MSGSPGWFRPSPRPTGTSLFRTPLEDPEPLRTASSTSGTEGLAFQVALFVSNVIDSGLINPSYTVYGILILREDLQIPQKTMLFPKQVIANA